MRAVLLRLCACAALGLLLCDGQVKVLAQESGAAVQAPKPFNPAVAEKLVKYVIIAVDQGNATGNYSVLRELGTARFQAATSSGRLSEAFANLRKMKLDLSALMMLKPVFTNPPVIDNGQLRIAGYFATTPIRINFTMSFAQQNGVPRIANLNIVPVKATAAAGDEALGGTGKSDAQ